MRSLPQQALPVDYGAEANFSGAIEEFGPLDKQMARTIKKGLKVMCREIQMGVAAAQLAIDKDDLTTRLDAERQQAAEKLELLNEAKQMLADQFKALANDVYFNP